MLWNRKKDFLKKISLNLQANFAEQPILLGSKAAEFHKEQRNRSKLSSRNSWMP